MKKLIMLLCLSTYVHAIDLPHPFIVYNEKQSLDNHYIPSGYMGDYRSIKVDQGWTIDPHQGKTCIKVVMSNAATEGASWSGVYWQYPANNWGNMRDGYNLNGFKKLKFWAKGETGKEVVAEFKVGGITGEHSDSGTVSTGSISLSKTWQEYTIDLEGLELSNIIGGFAWAASLQDNPDGMTFFLDDVRYE